MGTIDQANNSAVVPKGSETLEQSCAPKFMGKTIEENKELGVDFADVNQWKTLKAYAKEHNQFTLDQLKLLANRREVNGLSVICKKIGKTLYLHDSAFGLWVYQQ